MRILVVDVENVTACTMEVPADRAGETLLLPREEYGVLKAIQYEPLELADRRGKTCWIYVRATR